MKQLATFCYGLMFLLGIALAVTTLVAANDGYTKAPIVDDLECVGGCQCCDKGCCKCFTSTNADSCRCKKCTCNDDEDK